jgi:hypothetical protein
MKFRPRTRAEFICELARLSGLILDTRTKETTTMHLAIDLMMDAEGTAIEVTDESGRKDKGKVSATQVLGLALVLDSALGYEEDGTTAKRVWREFGRIEKELLEKLPAHALRGADIAERLREFAAMGSPLDAR